MSAINFQSKTQTLLSDNIVVKIIVEIIVWRSVALLDYVFGFLHHIQLIYGGYASLMNYHRLNIDVAFLVISLKMYFVSWGWGGGVKVAIDQ